MLRKSFFVLLLLSLSVFVAPVSAQSCQADVRFFHALSGVPAADVYLNEFFLGTLEYGQAAEYALVPCGEVTVRAFAPGESSNPLFEGTFNAETDVHLNVALAGTLDTPALSSHPINFLDVPPGQARVILIHAVADATDVSLTAHDGTTLNLAEGLTFGSSASVDVPAGRYTLNDVPLNLNAGTVYSIFMTGADDGTVQPTIFAGLTELSEPSGLVRFVHAIPGASAVDIYLNDTLTGVNLEPEQATTYMGLLPGSYTVELFEAGADPAIASPLLVGTLSVEPDVANVMVAMPISGTHALTLFRDDRTAVEANTGRLMIFNASSAPVNLSVDGSVAAENISPGSLAQPVTLADGAHNLEVTTTGGYGGRLAFLENFTVPNFAANTIRTLVVTDNGVIQLSSRPLPES